MHSEWMKVMLEEVARKREEAERGREELRRRAAGGKAGSKATQAPRAEPSTPRR